MEEIYKAAKGIHAYLGEAAKPFGLTAEHLEVGFAALGTIVAAILLSNKNTRNALDVSAISLLQYATSSLNNFIDLIKPILTSFSELLKILQLMFPELAYTLIARILILLENVISLMDVISQRSPRALYYS